MTVNTLYVQGSVSLQFTMIVKHKLKNDGIMGQYSGVKALKFGMSHRL